MSGEADTDSESSYYSAGEEAQPRVTGSAHIEDKKVEAGKSPISKKLERSLLDSSASAAQAAGSTGANTETQGKEEGESRPVPPPRRRKKHKEVTSAEEPASLGVNQSDSVAVRHRSHTVPSRARRSMSQGSGISSGRDEPDTQPIHNLPSISIESDTSLELTEDLMAKVLEVESCDALLARARGSNNTGEGVIIIQSDDESIDGEQVLLTDSLDQSLECERRVEEAVDGVEDEQSAANIDSDLQPTDSQILEETIVKNLDTGDVFPLSAVEKMIPQGKSPVDSYCDQRERESRGEASGGADIDTELVHDGSQRHKPRLRKKIRKFFVKGREKKTKSEGRHGDTTSGSDEDLSPEHDQQSVKYKAASHNKGKLDFERVRLKQELCHNQGAVWVMKFSICGRLLATGGQDSIVRVWVLRNAHQFFYNLQSKYARMGVHSSGDSISEKASSSLSGSDPDVSTANSKPFLDQPLCTYHGHSADVLDLSWSKNFFLLSSSMDKTVRLCHISRTECLCCFQHVDFVTAIAFHPRDDRYFLSGSLDGKLRLWNIPDKKVALWNEIEGVGSHFITAANFCNDGKLAVAGTYDGRCIFYETEHLKYHTQIHVKSRHGKNRGRKISGIEPLPGEDKILVTSNDSRIRLYNLRDHSLTCKYRGCLNTSSQIRASFSRDGQFIVCGSEDNFIYVWKTHHDFSKLSSSRRDRNDCYEMFSAHAYPVTAAVFAPVPGITVDEGLRDIGEVVVAGDYQGHIKVYVNSDDL